MRRAILKLGDKTTSDGVVLEGIDSCRHHGTPMTFIGAKIWCPACNSEGVIGWKGPHRKATMMGKQQALEGDICLCNCDPPPVLLASQNSAWHVFDAHELGEATGAGQSMAGSDPGRYDEQFRLVDDTGLPRVSVRYRVLIGSNIVASGVTDSAGRTSRIVTDASQQLRLDIAH
ncbi:PAAR domain-containing protein [Paraburkholderia sp. J7]|uniref:PAAR domain-containing protein n=1 Tax=Paraburkholderia sp. J7 TaxID=2805438 RepID=UPI002AB73441|nr:PAAR domain-containing protein [Paraburkholderia sp. J7]